MGKNVAIPTESEKRLFGTLKIAIGNAYAEVNDVRASLDFWQSYMIVIFAVRMAVLAARTRSPECLKTAMVAAIMGGDQLDSRDMLGAFGIIEDCAKRLGLVFREECDSLSRLFAGRPIETVAADFFARPSDLQSVESVGYTAALCEDGLCYKHREL